MWTLDSARSGDVAECLRIQGVPQFIITQLKSLGVKISIRENASRLLIKYMMNGFVAIQSYPLDGTTASQVHPLFGRTLLSLEKSSDSNYTIIEQVKGKWLSRTKMVREGDDLILTKFVVNEDQSKTARNFQTFVRERT